MTRKWNIVNDNSKAKNDVANEIIYNTEVLRSCLCYYNNAYILVIGNISIKGHQATQVAFKNCVPFTSCITKISGTVLDDAEHLDLTKPLNNLIKYCSNYSETKGSVSCFILKMKQLILMQILPMPIILNFQV